jgi:hypothetical protein
VAAPSAKSGSRDSGASPSAAAAEPAGSSAASAAAAEAAAERAARAARRGSLLGVEGSEGRGVRRAAAAGPSCLHACVIVLFQIKRRSFQVCLLHRLARILSGATEQKSAGGHGSIRLQASASTAQASPHQPSAVWRASPKRRWVQLLLGGRTVTTDLAALACAAPAAMLCGAHAHKAPGRWSRPASVSRYAFEIRKFLPSCGIRVAPERWESGGARPETMKARMARRARCLHLVPHESIDAKFDNIHSESLDHTGVLSSLRSSSLTPNAVRVYLRGASTGDSLKLTQ